MKKFLLITIFSAIPFISFAQTIGCGLLACPNGMKCVEVFPGSLAIDIGQCVTAGSPPQQKPQPAPQPQPVPLPTWYGTEDRVTAEMTQAPQSTFLSWFTSAFTGSSATTAVKDQCAKPGATTCTLTVNGVPQFGFCTRKAGNKNKTCTPGAYARAPQITPTTTYVPALPTTYVPCNTAPTTPNQTSPTRPSSNSCYLPPDCTVLYQPNFHVTCTTSDANKVNDCLGYPNV